ncbi:hypothetical protein ACHAPU_005976 [Fusarium lateritium]
MPPTMVASMLAIRSASTLPTKGGQHSFVVLTKCIKQAFNGKGKPFLGPDNQSKMRRSVENAEHFGLFTPTAGAQFRDEQRRRHSQYDRGTRLAALEEI